MSYRAIAATRTGMAMAVLVFVSPKKKLYLACHRSRKLVLWSQTLTCMCAWELEHPSRFKVQTRNTCSLSNRANASLVVFPSLVKYPTNLSVISFQDATLASLKLSVPFSRIIVWNILSYFVMYVSVSNLHFPQMKLASQKPPEAVLEGVIFKIFRIWPDRIFLASYGPVLLWLHSYTFPVPLSNS